MHSGWFVSVTFKYPNKGKSGVTVDGKGWRHGNDNDKGDGRYEGVRVGRIITDNFKRIRNSCSKVGKRRFFSGVLKRVFVREVTGRTHYVYKDRITR